MKRKFQKWISLKQEISKSGFPKSENNPKSEIPKNENTHTVIHPSEEIQEVWRKLSQNGFLGMDRFSIKSSGLGLIIVLIVGG